MTNINSGKHFINLLEEISGLKPSNATTVQLANTAWDLWEKQGVFRGKDANDVISQPYIIFNNYYQDILKANNLDEKNFYYCFAKTKELNAYANTTKNGDYVVVFDSELYRFISDIIITCIICVYTQPSEKEVNFYFEHIFDLLLEFKGVKINNNPDKQSMDFMKIITKDYDLTMLGSYCSAAIYTFIVCHELGHHILGHTTTKKIKKTIFSEDKEHFIDFNNTNYQEEYDADKMGLHLYINITKKYQHLAHLKLNHQFLSVPLIFFKLLELVDIIKKTISSTHPEPILRHARLKNIKIALNLEEDTELYDALIEIFSDLIQWVHQKKEE